MSRVEFKNRSVIIDGKPVQIISGAMHYFRVPREYWRDRMEKAVQLGLNGIETYMCWNLHERTEGNFDFSGMLDFEAYIRLAQEMGLYVIVRPGPYICAEWDNGGLPAWLMKKSGIRYRRMNKPYIDALTNYMNVIIPKLKALQFDEGGPIIAMQVENEYGSYSCDKEYLTYLRSLYRNAGVTIPLFTADGVSFWGDPANRDLMLRGGTIEGSPACLNFGSRALASFDVGKAVRPDDPPFCMEFWCGWFDAWGCGKHHTRSAESTIDELEDMLSAGASVDFYMYHGGTNFEFTAGANGTADSDYAPDVTSYDYDALLDEAGNPTEKYFAAQKVIRKYAPDRPFGTPEKSRTLPARKLEIAAVAELFDNLDNAAKKVADNSPLSFEELDQPFGYVLYRTKLPGNGRGCFELQDVRDRADLYLNGDQIYTYYRKNSEKRTNTHEFSAGATLDVLVENLGRINYGPLCGKDSKGVCGDIRFEWQALVGWEMWCLPSATPPAKLNWKPYTPLLRSTPAYYKVEFDVEDPADTYLKFPGIHGGAWINGHVLGRYWNIGPGSTLYIPGVWLKKGKNELVIFETEKLVKPYVRLLDQPELDKTIEC